jgi:hypothetical protein
MILYQQIFPRNSAFNVEYKGDEEWFFQSLNCSFSNIREDSEALFEDVLSQLWARLHMILSFDGNINNEIARYFQQLISTLNESDFYTRLLRIQPNKKTGVYVSLDMKDQNQHN